MPQSHASTPHNNTNLDVLLATMPFGPLYQPSIGLTLLKDSLSPLNLQAEILYLTLQFGNQIGPKLYNRIAAGRPYQDLVGEWLFSDDLFGRGNTQDWTYIDGILRRKDPKDSRQIPVSESYISQLLWVKKQIPIFMDYVVQKILDCNPKILGLTSIFQQHVASLALAKRVKEARSEITIIMGGANCEDVMGAEVVNQFSFIDYVVSGEGDIIFPELAGSILAGKSSYYLQGVFSKDNLAFKNINGQFLSAPPVKEMDNLPPLDYDDFFHQAQDILEPQKISLPFETSRGCWWGEKHHCTFCGLNGSTMDYRSKSQERALEELYMLSDSYPDQSIFVVDNILDMRYFKHFIPTLKENRIPSELFYEVKANLRKEQLVEMIDAGITRIQPGVESLSDHVLDLMRKGVSVSQNIQLLKWCKELGMELSWNVIWGFPGETPEDYLEMGELIPLLTHLKPPVGTSQLRLDRFSPNYEEAAEFGITNIRATLPYQYIYPFEEPIVRNLAYHFTYEYENEQDVSSYSQPILRKLKQWRENSDATDMFSVDLGDILLIWDFRPIAKSPLTILRNSQKEFYELCDKGQIRNSLISKSSVEGENEKLLDWFVEQKLIAHVSNRYVSLAVPLGLHTPTLTVLGKLRDCLLESDIIIDTHTQIHQRGQKLTADYFHVTIDGKVVVLQKALENLISGLNLSETSSELIYTAGGITFNAVNSLDLFNPDVVR